MADELNLPPRLKTWLDEGCDLTLIPDLETYARVIVIGRHRVPEEERARLAAFFWHNLEQWLNGESVETPAGPVEPNLSHIRHAMWMVEGLTDMEVAERFEAALPEELRAACWRRIGEVGHWTER